MITKAYIQEYGNGKTEPEFLEVKTVLESRGVDCEFFTIKKLHRNHIQLSEETLIVGDHSAMVYIFKRLGINSFTSSYPQSLRHYLKRSVWETTVKKLMMQSHEDCLNIFVKPKSKIKLFTGFVINSQHDLLRLESFSKETALFCSSVVEWLSEFRVFVNHSEIVGIKNYSGNENLQLDMDMVKNAIKDFENSDERTKAYGIDFGILKSGETALVEWNDGFALGSYGLEKDIYTDLLINRWKELFSISNLNL